VVATSPAAAQKLVSVANPTELSRVALMDLALTRDLGIPAGVLDLDERMYLARYTAFDRTLAPPGEELVQIACASPPGETSSGARTRIERVLDRLAGDWRRQLRWSRHSLQAGATGALDLPGRDWRARPPIVHDDGVFIAGDYVAAPGLLSEVSFASGREAGAAAAAWALQPPGTLQHDLPRTARPRLTLERDHEPAVRGGITR
jgi:hypothetical protein